MKNLREEIKKILPVGRVAGGMERDELLFLFRQTMEEVVGGKEEEVDDDGTFNTGADYRNSLRAEQRERRNQLVGKEDK